jgi:ABC-type Fe3+/spermidine/putrescine transport system ATPase subunit
MALAGALLQSPELLLLDEPTNHLDIDAIRLLEVRLESFGGRSGGWVGRYVSVTRPLVLRDPAAGGEEGTSAQKGKARLLEG